MSTYVNYVALHLAAQIKLLVVTAIKWLIMNAIYSALLICHAFTKFTSFFFKATKQLQKRKLVLRKPCVILADATWSEISTNGIKFIN